jgi:hypothetical protein
MTEQAITQEELFLPLLHLLADYGGEIDRANDQLLDVLADRLGLTTEERNRTTDQDREQWRSTVEYSRQKLLDLHDAIDHTSPRGIWRLSVTGWNLVRNPTAEMLSDFASWRKGRSDVRPDSAPPPPEIPQGDFDQRFAQLADSLKRTRRAALRLKRNQALVRELKNAYESKCQLCDPAHPEIPRIPIDNNRFYVEVHHLEGLAELANKAEDGQLDDSAYADVTSHHNLIVVCAHHHRVIHNHLPQLVFSRETLRFESTAGDLQFGVRLHQGTHLLAGT